MANLVEITVRANDDASKTADAIRAKLDDLGKVTVTPKISLQGAAVAAADIQVVKDLLDVLGHSIATPKINVQGASAAATQITAVGAAAKTAGAESGGLSSSLGVLATPMGGLIAAGVALSPVILTVATGLAGFGLAAEQNIAPIVAASQATGGLKANMGSLTPVQQGMAQGLLALGVQVHSFTASMQPEVVSVWGNALKLAGGLLGDIQPVAKATGSALSGVVADISADLKTQQWQNFFTFMAQNAGPDIRLLGSLFIRLMNDLPPLLEQLQPVAEALLKVATGAAQGASALEALNPVVDANARSNDKAAQSTTGWLGAVERFFDGGKAVQAQVLGIKQSTDSASDSLSKAAVVTQAAVTPVGQLSAAMSTAATNTKNLDTAWNVLVGNFNSEQQAIVAAKQAVEGYGTAVKTSGAGSLAAQSQFYAAVQSLQQMTDAEVKNHAPASQLYNDIEAQIKALQSKGPLNKAEQQDLDNLQKAASAAATSTSGLSGQEQSLAKVIGNGLLPQMTALHTSGTTLNTDMKNLATSILNTGTQSTASKGARAALIADLEASGVKASTAKSDVDNYIKSLRSIPASVKSTVTVVGSGSGTITFAEQNIKNAQTGFLEFHAAGGPIGGHGGPTQDNIPVMASKGEFMMQADAVDHYGVGFMHAVNAKRLAGGGLVDASQFVNAPSWMAGIGKSAAQGAEGTDAALMVADMQAKIAAAAAAQAAAAAKNMSGIGTSGVSNSSAYAALQSAAAKMGWTGAQWTALYDVEMREAGFNLTAQNPSSGAYGLAQFINGPSEYATYGGNSTTAAGQAVAMVNYVKQRYGNPEAAWAHEVNFGWYDNGGWLKPGLTMAYNGTGKPEQVGGGGGGPVLVQLEIAGSGQSAVEAFLLEIMRNLTRVKGGGNVQAAFGRN